MILSKVEVMHGSTRTPVVTPALRLKPAPTKKRCQGNCPGCNNKKEAIETAASPKADE